ncbi:MAG: rRNA maturation RNase YbeY [Candidatus Kerfeldbacteria bacterium]|nr:rRNA maturation RNase YbeY [Candidatus Kerfeldbacteria bacterium]
MPARNVRRPFITIRVQAVSGISPTVWRRWALAAQRRLPLHLGWIAVVMVSPSLMQKLNKRYRRRSRPTNVLSFPYPPAEPGMGDSGGEIFLCPAVIRQEARNLGQPMRGYSRFLLQHGWIHLAGHDHATKQEARRWHIYERRLSHEPH